MDLLTRHRPDWGSEEIVVGRRVNGIYARLSVRERHDGGFLGTVTCGYPWWTAPTVASSAEVAATAAAEDFDERFGHAVGTQEARAAERYIEGRSHGLLIRRGDGTHVLNNEHSGGMLSLLSHDGLGTHAWADAVDLSDFPALRDLHQGVGPIRLGDPLFQMLDSVHRGAWEFGYAEAADYIHDMHAIAALDYPTLVMPPPIVGWPTVREALISLIWPVSGLPLESYGREYYDALRRWLDGAATQLAPAYTGPGAEELGMALTVFDKRHGYIEDTRWEPRSMGGVGGSPATD